MGPPKGPAAARSGSTWIHWWSSVASANRFTRAWSTGNQSDQPRCCPDKAWNSSALRTVVAMGPDFMPAKVSRTTSVEPDAFVLAALGVEVEAQKHAGEEQ